MCGELCHRAHCARKLAGILAKLAAKVYACYTVNDFGEEGISKTEGITRNGRQEIFKTMLCICKLYRVWRNANDKKKRCKS
jgi:hypothetical protein